MSGLGHHQKDTTKTLTGVSKERDTKCTGGLGVNAPLNSKGTTSDWENIKGLYERK